MYKRLLSCLFFLLFACQTTSMEEIEIEVDTGSQLQQEDGHSGTRQVQTVQEEQSLLFQEDRPNLFDCLNQEVFNEEVHGLALTFRWLGRGVGGFADVAIIPMMLYVILGLANAPIGEGAFHWTTVGLTLLFLTLPSLENMGQFWEEAAYACLPYSPARPQVPEPYKRKSSPYITILKGSSLFHAATMGLLLTTIFHNIEYLKDGSKTGFWVTFAPYFLGVARKNWSVFNHGRTIQNAQDRYERAGEQVTRKVFGGAIEKFEQETLRSLSDHELRELYDFLKNPQNTGKEKLKKIYETEQTLIMSPMSETSSLVNDSSMSHANRTLYIPPKKLGNTLAKLLGNCVYFVPVYSEFYLYKYGLDLWGVGDIASYTGAGILSAISLIERKSIIQFYDNLFKHKFGSSLSRSNPKLRTFFGGLSFLLSSGLSLSEVYPSWNYYFSGSIKGNPFNVLSYPILVFSILRHHARNTLWMQKGYDLFLSNWLGCFCGCVKNSKEAMINSISLSMRKLSIFQDKLNADGIAELHQAYFRYAPNYEL